MKDLATRAELVKLARILDTDVQDVEFLAYLEPQRLRALREGITEALFEKFRPSFTGLARLSSHLPLAISTRISERVLGPLLSARIAGEMPPEKAIQMAGRLPDTFLADTCLQLDPVRAESIIAGFPVERAVAITHILLRRREYITMGHFVDVLPRPTLLAAADGIADEADLLEISFFVENSDQLDHVIEHLDEVRRTALLAAAARDDLWPEVIATLLRIGRGARVSLAELALAQDDSTLDSLIRAAADNDLWPALLQMAGELDEGMVARLAQQTAFDESPVICSVIDSVIANDLWAQLRDQLPGMGTARCRRMLEVGAHERGAFVSELDRRLAQQAVGMDVLGAAVATLDAQTRRQARECCSDGPLAGLLEQ